MILSIKYPTENGYCRPFHKCRHSRTIWRPIALQYILIDYDILRKLAAKIRLRIFSIAIGPSDHGRKAVKFRLVRNGVAIIRNIQLRLTHIEPGCIEMFVTHIRLNN